MKKFVFLFAFVFVATFATASLAQTKKVDVCHYDGNAYSEINISRNALPAHTAHGDAEPGYSVPNMPGYEFNENCLVVLAQPNFVTFNIRNSNGTIAEPWDDDMSIVENEAGNGFTAITPRGGQKVGYGTNFFDGKSITSLETVNWDKLSGKVGLVAYLNIWVTDGNNYAIIASENDYRGTDFAARQEWKVFEYNSAAGLDWLCASGTGAVSSQYLTCNGVKVTMADLASNVIIQSPTFNPAPPGVGTGAPRGGYGFNLIFGDTQANFIGSYSLENLSATASGVTYNPTN